MALELTAAVRQYVLRSRQGIDDAGASVVAANGSPVLADCGELSSLAVYSGSTQVVSVPGFSQ